MMSAEMILEVIQSELQRYGNLAHSTKLKMDAAVTTNNVNDADKYFELNKRYMSNYMLLADLLIRVTRVSEATEGTWKMEPATDRKESNQSGEKSAEGHSAEGGNSE